MRTDQLIELATREAEDIQKRKQMRQAGTAQQMGFNDVHATGNSIPEQRAPFHNVQALNDKVPNQMPLHNFHSDAASASVAPAMAHEIPASQMASAGSIPPAPRTNWQEGLPLGNRQIASKGLIFVFGFLALFFAWALFFPISSAVVSVGKMVSAGSNKLVQHPIGGSVKAIYARDGDFVTKGQKLLLLDSSASKAELTRLIARQERLQALQVRLNSERGDSGFDNGVTVSGLKLRGAQGGFATNAAKAEGQLVSNNVLQEQRLEFDAGRKRLAAEVAVVASQIESLKDERSGLQARIAGGKRLLESTRMELARMRPLVNDGYLPKARFWELDRRRLEQITNVTNLEATEDATTQRIVEAEARKSQLEQADKENRAEELTEITGELGEISDQIKAARASFEASELRAPATGTLTKMSANTEGGVIRAGDIVAEIVPKDAGLITEFRVQVLSIKAVKVGQKARVVVSAFNRRTYDPIQGEVIYVSADSEVDDATGEEFFTARAKLKPNTEKNTGLNEIQAGMTTEVYALGEPRVFMDYVLQPIRDSFSKAFIETK